MPTIAQAKRKEMLEDRETFATVLLAILLDSYGTEMFDWEPETLRMEVSDDFNATLPRVNSDKVWGLIVAMTTNQFYLSVEIYRTTCEALMGKDPDFAMFSPSDPEELAWGVTEVILNDPPDPKLGNGEFSNEVSRYTGLILSQNGILVPPEPLIFAAYDSENPVLAMETIFSEDPVMFDAAYSNQQRLKSTLDSFIKERVTQLQMQLKSVPLVNRQKT